MKNLTKIGGVTAVVAALALTACGGGGGAAKGPEAGKGQEAGSDLAKLVSINAKDAKDLQPGGTVTLPLGNLGPDFNGFSNNGNSADNTALHRPIDQAGTWGCWNFDFDGTATPNKDFCEDVKSEVKDGKQTITIKVNPKATYNDGTPIDVKTFENTWKMLNGQNKDIDVVSSGAYEFVDSVKAGSSPKEVIVTTTQPVYPLDSLFTGFVHPAVNTPAIFNDGFTGDMHPEWMAGPFKVDKYDSAAKTVTLAQNEKWWGNKPVLDKVVFRQLESSAAIAAFKNGEIDGVSANTITPYKQLDGTKNSEIRRGQRLFAGGLNLNAKKVLTDAGYKPNAAGIMEKDGVPAAFKISNFGDDPTTLAFAQTLQNQLKAGGMDVGIDQRASADFGKVVGSRDFFLSVSGYTVGADATDAVKQFYDSKTNSNKLGDADLDAKIKKLSTIPDNAERNKAAMDVEKEHMEKYFSMGVVMNGPQISFVRTGLANYGPSLFKSLSQVPDWTTIGWEKK